MNYLNRINALSDQSPFRLKVSLFDIHIDTYLCDMRGTLTFLFALPLAAQGHVHVSGVPVSGFGFAQRLFEPIDQNFCNAQAQQSPISCVQANLQGTPYCSSFLNIPTATV